MRRFSVYINTKRPIQTFSDNGCYTLYDLKAEALDQVLFKNQLADAHFVTLLQSHL